MLKFFIPLYATPELLFMDTFLIITGFILTLLGIAGAFLPVLPGPLTGWAGLLLLYFSKTVPVGNTLLYTTLAIAVLIFILDYTIPAMGTKHFGGTKYGATGTTIGLIVGLIVPIPLGFIIGAFAGAFIGEMIHDHMDVRKAVKGAIGSFLGFLASTTLKLIVSLFFAGIFITKVVGNLWG